MSQSGHPQLEHLPLGRIRLSVVPIETRIRWTLRYSDTKQTVCLLGQSCEGLGWYHIARLSHWLPPSQRRAKIIPQAVISILFSPSMSSYQPLEFHMDLLPIDTSNVSTVLCDKMYKNRSVKVAELINGEKHIDGAIAFNVTWNRKWSSTRHQGKAWLTMQSSSASIRWSFYSTARQINLKVLSFMCASLCPENWWHNMTQPYSLMDVLHCSAQHINPTLT